MGCGANAAPAVYLRRQKRSSVNDGLNAANSRHLP